MDRYCKRLIEVDLPIKRISAHARREKNIHDGHISTLHLWWARRPLAACRAMACAALWPDPVDELCPPLFRKVAQDHMTRWASHNLSLASEETYRVLISLQKEPGRLDDPLELRNALLHFIADFASWTNATIPDYLETSRALTEASHRGLGGEPGKRPTVLDPFAGGGAIPLEATRVGAEAVAFDINSVPVLLNKLLLERLPSAPRQLAGRLLKEAEGIQQRCLKKLGHLYSRQDGTSIAYIWARTVACEGPGCGIELPLTTSGWLSKRRGNYVWLEFHETAQDGRLAYEIRTSRSLPAVPPVGTSRMGAATCPCCGYTTPKKAVYQQLDERRGGAQTARLIASVVKRTGESGRSFLQPTTADLTQARQAELLRQALDSEVLAERINPISPGKFGSGVASPTRIGCETFADLFTPRQLVVLEAFSAEVASVEDETVQLLLACAVDRVADYNSAHTRWNINNASIGDTFGRQAISISWSFAEANPFSGAAGSWESAIRWIRKVVEHLDNSRLVAGQADRSSATALPLPDDSVAALLTDPPYYGAIMYADLSDFFFVWLKRSVGDSLPRLFSEIVVPKEEEIIATPTSLGPSGQAKDAMFFEEQMRLALAEARRVVAPSGVGTIVFAHKSTDGWEAMLSALVGAGWVVTASWPIDTERVGRTNAQGTAALSSSIHLVCRPRENADGSLRIDDVGDWRNVLEELPRRIHRWMPRLAEEGVVGADAIFACLGPALEIYSQYSSVEKASGEEVTLKEYLQEVWAAVSREALSMIFDGADASGFEEDARLTAMWLWTLHTSSNGDDDGEGEDKAKSLRGYSLEYDAARKIAQGLGAHLEVLGNLVEVKGGTATLLSAGARTRHLLGKDAGRGRTVQKPQMALDFAEEVRELEAEYGDWAEDLSGGPGSTVLDQLHQSMILFGAGRIEVLRRLLVEDGVGRNPMFWRLAQALSALYPSVTEEKRWVDGVLGRKKGLGL